MGKGFVMLDIETAHGVYSVLAAREGDDAPAGATHTVFDESGSLAGYASDVVAWGTDWAELGRVGSLSDAAAMVAAVDGELLGFSADGADFRRVDGPHVCGLDGCGCHLFAGDEWWRPLTTGCVRQRVMTGR
jgi:hypothetical protein